MQAGLLTGKVKKTRTRPVTPMLRHRVLWTKSSNTSTERETASRRCRRAGACCAQLGARSFRGRQNLYRRAAFARSSAVPYRRVPGTDVDKSPRGRAKKPRSWTTSEVLEDHSARSSGSLPAARWLHPRDRQMLVQDTHLPARRRFWDACCGGGQGGTGSQSAPPGSSTTRSRPGDLDLGTRRRRLPVRFPVQKSMLKWAAAQRSGEPLPAAKGTLRAALPLSPLIFSSASAHTTATRRRHPGNANLADLLVTFGRAVPASQAVRELLEKLVASGAVMQSTTNTSRPRGRGWNQAFHGARANRFRSRQVGHERSRLLRTQCLDILKSQARAWRSKEAASSSFTSGPTLPTPRLPCRWFRDGWEVQEKTV